jgi:hypothetical protein
MFTMAKRAVPVPLIDTLSGVPDRTEEEKDRRVGVLSFCPGTAERECRYDSYSRGCWMEGLVLFVFVGGKTVEAMQFGGLRTR